LSLDDSLLRIFASERVSTMMQRLGMQSGEAIESGMVSRVIENAQRKVEAHNFDTRKHLLDFDDVANDQRRVIYAQRNELLESDDISGTVVDMQNDVLAELIDAHMPPGSIDDQWDVPGLEEGLRGQFGIEAPVGEWLDADDQLNAEGVRERLEQAVVERYEAKEADVQALGVNMREVEKSFVLQVLDNQWKEHLAAMDFMRQGIGLRGMAQRDPKQEFKKEAFQMFQELLGAVKREAIRILFNVNVQSPEDARAAEAKREAERERAMQFQHAQSSALGDASSGSASSSADAERQPFVRGQRKVGRNEACPCGSGKKYKHCHGQRLGSTAAGVRKADELDLVVMELAAESEVATVFTRNQFCAAPVQWAKAHVRAAKTRYLLINTGNANAGTGAAGERAVEQNCQALAALTGCQANQVLPYSTGVIGELLPAERIDQALPAALANLSAEGWATAADAIRTTDTRAKGRSCTLALAGGSVTLTGIAKGSGMIRPDMATMLAFIA
jgi:hypothetical protein